MGGGGGGSGENTRKRGHHRVSYGVCIVKLGCSSNRLYNADVLFLLIPRSRIVGIEIDEYGRLIIGTFNTSRLLGEDA